MTEKTFATGDYTVTYDDTYGKKVEVFNKIIDWCKKYESFSGESMCQSDDPQIEAVYLLADIADNVIKFEVKYND